MGNIRHADRRTLLFQEFLQRARETPNVYNWPTESLPTYWFGYFKTEDQAIPELVPATDESLPLSTYINMKTPKQMGAIILIPQSQIGPVCGKLCQACDRCTPAPSSA